MFSDAQFLFIIDEIQETYGLEINNKTIQEIYNEVSDGLLALDLADIFRRSVELLNEQDYFEDAFSKKSSQNHKKPKKMMSDYELYNHFESMLFPKYSEQTSHDLRDFHNEVQLIAENDSYNLLSLMLFSLKFLEDNMPSHYPTSGTEHKTETHDKMRVMLKKAHYICSTTISLHKDGHIPFSLFLEHPVITHQAFPLESLYVSPDISANYFLDCLYSVKKIKPYSFEVNEFFIKNTNYFLNNGDNEFFKPNTYVKFQETTQFAKALAGLDIKNDLVMHEYALTKFPQLFFELDSTTQKKCESVFTKHSYLDNFCMLLFQKIPEWRRLIQNDLMKSFFTYFKGDTVNANLINVIEHNPDSFGAYFYNQIDKKHPLFEKKNKQLLFKTALSIPEVMKHANEKIWVELLKSTDLNYSLIPLVNKNSYTLSEAPLSLLNYHDDIFKLISNPLLRRDIISSFKRDPDLAVFLLEKMYNHMNTVVSVSKDSYGDDVENYGSFNYEKDTFLYIVQNINFDLLKKENPSEYEKRFPEFMFLAHKFTPHYDSFQGKGILKTASTVHMVKGYSSFLNHHSSDIAKDFINSFHDDYSIMGAISNIYSEPKRLELLKIFQNNIISTENLDKLKNEESLESYYNSLKKIISKVSSAFQEKDLNNYLDWNDFMTIVRQFSLTDLEAAYLDSDDKNSKWIDNLDHSIKSAVRQYNNAPSFQSFHELIISLSEEDMKKDLEQANQLSVKKAKTLKF